MRQPALYVATVRKSKVLGRDFMGAIFYANLIEDMAGQRAKITVRLNDLEQKNYTVWTIEPRPRHEAFYK